MISTRLDIPLREFVNENNNLSLLKINKEVIRNIANKENLFILNFSKIRLNDNVNKINFLKEELITLVAQLKLKYN